MKVIIAGSRTINDYSLLEKAIALSAFSITKIISGCANGVDRLGIHYAANNNIKVELFPAKWDLYGKSAGYIRNKAMAEEADALIALWNGESRGTKHMIDIAKEKGLKVFVYEV